ncbi:globin [Elysia marginata]|uniref:Globin n=1 Tax=Elysia marginata TaxID=1093978 RepID=A0AAV4FUF7_9GAST|nr:globin [Elysia marginata]
MGGVMSLVLSWVTPDPTFDLTPDPVTGLSERDCHAIMESWALLTAERKSMKLRGTEFFIELFETHPYMQDSFPLFKDRPVGELRACPQMGAHATSVMYALKSYVGSVDDVETLVALATKIATSHVARGITVGEFDKVAVVLVNFLKSKLGSSLTTEAEVAWKQLFKVHNDIYRGIEMKSKNNNRATQQLLTN